MNALERYWLAPVPAVRVWLVLRVVLLLFALDVFREHLRTAWRFGAADFNVPHFPVLETLPSPSVATYVGAMIAIGLAAFVVALAPRPPRALSAGIAAVYLWSWSTSMLDSWQHHYLLSLFLIALAMFPPISASMLFRDGERLPRASAFGLVVLWSTAAIVYGWSAVGKTEPGWLDGTVLREITRDGETIPGVVAMLAAVGIEGDALWRWLARGVVAVETVCAIGYATAPLRDRAGGRARIGLEIVAWAALVLALAFHVGTAFMELEIGWFGGYMSVLALATFLPATWLGRACELATRPVVRAWSRRKGARERPRAVAVTVALACVSLVTVGLVADLPGAFAACGLAAAVLLVLTIGALVRKRSASLAAASIALSIGALGLAAMLVAIPDVRYDHWRFAGGDFRRRGEWARALKAYEHASAHADRESDRRDERLDELRERIAIDGPTRLE